MRKIAFLLILLFGSQLTNAQMINAFEGRKRKKRDLRSLWITRINAALRTEGVSYSKFIGMLKKANVEIVQQSLDSECSLLLRIELSSSKIIQAQLDKLLK